jgi:asparagine synthase (glutamine-hydrolysing)
MTDAIWHRGPDDAGIWTDSTAGLGLGFRRLSILDLTPDGHQPMASASGRYTIVFNGEVYNHRDLRTDLGSLGHSFRGHSDTEVMLAGIEQWGVTKAIQRFWGMFAFALWDSRERRLYLVRDRMGKKPLYFGWQGSTFLFGSELKSLRIHPAFQGEINTDALATYLRHNYIPGPYSIYQGIQKLRPGTILCIDPSVPGRSPEPEAYWDLRTVVEHGKANPFLGTEAEALLAIESLLGDAVARRMVADVPVGAFLSGGIDSSLVVALMQQHSPRPVRTFSIGFDNAAFNEAHHAKAVASHLGTEHTELYVRPEEARDVIPLLPSMYDEPFSDSSQIPTYLVSKMARRSVTVALSGDGGDEIFGGYSRYEIGARLFRKMQSVTPSLRKFIISIINYSSAESWDRGLEVLRHFLPRKFNTLVTGDRIHKLAGLLASDGVEGLYHRMVSRWPQPTNLLLSGQEHSTVLTDSSRWSNLKDPTEIMMYLDILSYLVDDILVKVDRATMASSLECRSPLLDHRLVEFAWTLPLSHKIQGSRGKVILRRLLDGFVPQSLIERPKQGFGVPLGDWLRGPLRGWAEELLDPDRMKNQGIFQTAPIEAKWQEHLSGNKNWSYHLWDILMFQAWIENNK